MTEDSSFPSRPESPATADLAEAAAPRAGDPCPHCGEGRLEYNGLLLLECDLCGYQAATPFICTC